MSSPLAIRLNELLLQEGEIAICFLGQAGLLIKAYPEQYFVIDPYLSDYCSDTYGLAFKRLTPSLLNEVEAAEATAILSPKIAVPCHFWMLPANSGGDPAAFAQNVSEVTEPRLMATGEVMVI